MAVSFVGFDGEDAFDIAHQIHKWADEQPGPIDYVDLKIANDNGLQGDSEYFSINKEKLHAILIYREDD